MDNPAQITVKGPKEVTAVFEKSYKLMIHTTGNGSVLKNPDQPTYKYKTNVELTAKPDKGWKFVKWKGDISSTDSIVQVTMDKAKDVTVVFKKAKYTINALTEGNGSIKYLLPHPLYYGDIVQFLADADKGNIFVKWDGDLSGSKNPQSLRIKGNTTVKAVFKTYAEKVDSFLNPILPERNADSTSKIAIYLSNQLPGKVHVKKIILRDQRDSVAYEDDSVGVTLSSHHYGGLLLSSTSGSMRLSDLRQYTIKWICEFRGEEFVKKGEVVITSIKKPFFGTESKAKKAMKTIHVNVDFGKKK
jgi:hypothetical protein